MNRYLPYIIRSTEDRVADFLKRQITDPKRRDYGGLGQTLIDPKPTVYALASVVAAYCCDESRYYRNPALKGPIGNALDFVAGELRETGTFDFPSCNFSSAPDTAFILKQLFPIHTLLEKTAGHELDEERARIRAIIEHAVIGVRDGGFHTPNHRWAIAAALYQGSSLFRNEAFATSLKEKADMYLAEGIDINEDGEYAERSTGNYNAVVNSSMITLYEETGDEKYLTYVRKNLEMMLMFMDSDDTIFTENSTRQDRGTREYGYKYFYHYLYIAERDGPGLFDSAAHKLIHDNVQKGDAAPLCLHRLMVNERLMTHSFKDKGYPVEYRKHFRASGVLRHRKGKFTYSVLENKRTFLIMNYNGMLISAGIGISYGDTRSFVVQDLLQTQNGCSMRYEAEGWYYTPFTETQGTADWWAMDHSKREKLINSRLGMTVELTGMDHGLDLTIRSDGYERIPVRLEIALPDQGKLTSDFFEIATVAGHKMILKEGMLTVDDGNSSCTFGPGFGLHGFTGHYSGEEEDRNHFVIVMTDYSPMDRTVSFRFAD